MAEGERLDMFGCSVSLVKWTHKGAKWSLSEPPFSSLSISITQLSLPPPGTGPSAGRLSWIRYVEKCSSLKKLFLVSCCEVRFQPSLLRASFCSWRWEEAAEWTWKNLRRRRRMKSFLHFFFCFPSIRRSVFHSKDQRFFVGFMGSHFIIEFIWRWEKLKEKQTNS